MTPYGTMDARIQGFAESLQHYTKMHKAKCTDHSIYGAQAGLQFVLLITLFTTACVMLTTLPFGA